jgi:predicted Zn-dependent protease
LGLVGWGGFSAQAQRTQRSSLQRLVDGRQALDARVSVREAVAGGVAPAFDAVGFARPDAVDLIAGGAHAGSLVSARSAKEYGLACTGAGGGEFPDSLAMDAGALPADELLSELGTGLYVSNLWYLNYSDRPAGRITGMTRFATLWVEDGEPVEPVEVMRFDETVFNLFGDALVGLGDRQEMLLDAGSYGRRSTGSVRVPAALVDGLTFTL